MYKNELIKIGLTKTQAAILDHAYEHGEQKASKIALAIGQPRGVIYKSMDELIVLGLMEKIEPGKGIVRFRAKHPRELERISAEKEKKFKQDMKMFGEVLPALISNYNLTQNRPGVKFYEGEEGFIKILDDTLTSKTEVYMFFNHEAMENEPKFLEVDKKYKQKRSAAEVRKKVIRMGNKPVTFQYAAKNDSVGELTQIRYLDKNIIGSKASIQIYDNKISFQIIEDENLIAVLVEDKHIYQLNKAWFEVLWEIAE